VCVRGQLRRAMEAGERGSVERESVYEYLRVLALCNQVMPEEVDAGTVRARDGEGT
jgi:hypothetical protein